MASPLRIRRRTEVCIDCAKCAKVCPANLPVDRLVQIRSAECIGCLECVAVCPSEGALFLAAGRSRPVNAYVFAAAILVVFVGAVGIAKASGHWHSAIPDSIYQHLIPLAGGLGHP